jgi:hypothetical protein
MDIDADANHHADAGAVLHKALLFILNDGKMLYKQVLALDWNIEAPESLLVL